MFRSLCWNWQIGGHRARSLTSRLYINMSACKVPYHTITSTAERERKDKFIITGRLISSRQLTARHKT